MHSMLSKMKANLEDDWTSYGIRIGAQGEEITPLHLATVTEKRVPLSVKAISWNSTMTELGILAKCLMVCRVSLAPQAQSGCKTELTRRMLQIFSVDPYYVDNVSGVTGLQHWISVQSFCCIVAALDRFLRKCPRHELERLRACTLGSQYKDCVMIGSINHVARTLSTTPGRVFKYIFNR
ncbi:unnamed protein product [Angiostrongylus costaricensis]|uniref:Rhabdo_ncap domain-containing protein n=1 Tax=Angiostrongylus costaricensis TaxID=334426 RepID=A0A0R3PS57_ANGCS|nr:unnamed protein product [Angiostrongylus costaricensis]